MEDKQTMTSSSSSSSSSSFDNDDWMKSRGLSCQGRWISFDDGHIPETIKQQANPDRCLAVYPEYMEERVPALRVFDNFLANNVVQAVYETTRQDNQPWGTYVSLQQVREYWKNNNKNANGKENNDSDSPDERLLEASSKDDVNAMRDHLALLAVEAFLRAALSKEETASLSFRKEGDRAVLQQQTCKNDGNSSVESGKEHDFWTMSDLDRIHGVAVWALGAVEGSQVPYHLVCIL
jgi:hypothetical protein